MPLDIQVGDLADRARRFMRLVGRIPFRLDETVVPVATLGALDQPPYRSLSGPRNFGARANAAAIALNFTNLCCVGPGSEIQPPATGAVRITQIHIRNGTAGALSYRCGIVLNPFGFAGALLEAVSVNLENPLAAAAAFPQLPPRLVSFGQIVELGFTPWVMIVPPLESVIVPCDMTVYGAWAVYVACTTVNNSVDASFLGTWYPDAQALAT